jgi:hypothetical protein
VLGVRRMARVERSEYERLARETEELLDGLNRLPEESQAFKSPFHPYGAEAEHQALLLRFTAYLDDFIKVLNRFEWSTEIDKYELLHQRRNHWRVGGKACRDGLAQHRNRLTLAMSQHWLDKWSRLLKVVEKEAGELTPP